MTESVPLIDAAAIEQLTPMPALIAALRAAVAMNRRLDMRRT